jgi:hypothetical protein
MDKRNRVEQRFRGGRIFLTLMALCLLIVFLQTGCTPEPGKETAGIDQGMTQTYTRDPFTLTQRLSKKEITIAEQLTLVLETAVPEGTDVEFPSYSASLGDFTLKDIRIFPVRMTGSGDTVRVVHQAAYLLEPYLSGTYTIPAMTVTYRDRKNDTPATQLVTEKIEVAVTSLLPPDTGQVEIKDIKPPLSLPANTMQQALVAGLVLFLALLALTGFIYWRKTAEKKERTIVQPRPEDIAQQELERLLAEDLLARGEIKNFHMRISDILRRYIENRFGLRAPERTTEEFLVALARAESPEHALLGKHKALLTDFLNQCDLVKFARHEPTLAESEKTVVICREFVEKTKERVQGVQGARGE